MTFENMRNTLKKLFAENSHLASSATGQELSEVKTEPVYSGDNDVLYSHEVRGRGWPSRRSRVTNRGSQSRFSNEHDKMNKRMNPLNRDGTVSVCAICGSKMHWVRKCPHT